MKALPDDQIIREKPDWSESWRPHSGDLANRVARDACFRNDQSPESLLARAIPASTSDTADPQAEAPCPGQSRQEQRVDDRYGSWKSGE